MVLILLLSRLIIYTVLGNGFFTKAKYYYQQTLAFLQQMLAFFLFLLFTYIQYSGIFQNLALKERCERLQHLIFPLDITQPSHST